MKIFKLTVICILAMIVTAQSSGEDHPDDPYAARGAELLNPFKRGLKQALVAGLAKGPENAITVCGEQAPSIAQALSVDGVKVGRTSHKLRNPANASPDWVSPVLQAYLEDPSERQPTLVTLADDRLGYVEPITLQPLCLACHGETLAPDVAAAIESRYPQDAATGFQVGDFRGVFWVEFPAAN